MRDIGLGEFKNTLEKVVENIVAVGETYYVDVGQGIEFVALPKHEYEAMCDIILRIGWAAHAMADEDGNMNTHDVVKKY